MPLIDEKSAPFAPLLARAVAHFNAGRWSNAESDSNAALALIPTHGAALNILAGVAMQQGRAADAIGLFERALKDQPRNPFLHFNLGEAYKRTQNLTAALPHFQRAGALKPDFADAFASAGDALRALGRMDAAKRQYEKALRLAPSSPAGLHGYGLVLLRSGAPKEAESCFATGLRSVAPNHPLAPVFWSNMGVARLQLGEGVKGLQALARAAELGPGSAEIWRLLSASLRNTKVVPTDETFRAIMLKLFERNDINPRNLATAAIAVLQQDEEIASCLRRIEDRPATVSEIIQDSENALNRLVCDPLFLALLASSPIPSVPIELLMVQLRRDLLAAAIDDPSVLEHESLPLVLALARQAFLNEHVYHASAEEGGLIDTMVRALDRDDLGRRPGDVAQIAMVAAYRPLADTPLADRLTSAAPSEVAKIVREHLVEPKLESELRATLPVLKPAADPVSLAVKQQYEESPYPRWTRCTLGSPMAYEPAVRMVLPHLGDGKIRDISNPRVMVAGCGTGLETMRVLNAYKNPSVMAIDLSSKSLGYAMRKLEEYRVTNVQHLQADILDLHALTERFDLIHSFGVIHHMDDPKAGLGILAGLLQDGGLISIGLYSEIGRRAVVKARAHIAEKGYPAGFDGVRQLRHDLMTQPRRSEMELVMSPGSDFWTTSDCRDLLFHVNEHRFTLLQVGDLLEAASLEFIGVQFSHAVDRNRFLEKYPRPGSIVSLDLLHQFECEHPETFGETYHIWARSRQSVRRKN